MSVGLIVLIVGLISIATAYLLTVSQNRRGGGDLSRGIMIRGSAGGVSPLTSLLMLLGEAAVAVGVVLLVIHII